jgi:hypothetical protein
MTTEVTPVEKPVEVAEASVDIKVEAVEPIYEVVDEYTLRAQKVTQEVVDVRYDVKELIAQRAAIVRQRDEQVSARNRELSEVDELLAQAAKLGLKGAKEYQDSLPVPSEEPVELADARIMP